jgi:hypothetical protein
MRSIKKSSKIIITIIIVIGLLLLSYYLVIEQLIVKKENEKDKLIDEEIDDRISPLTNQGLILEVNRIRHRGLLDKIMKFGISWRKKPTFYVVTNIDDGKYSSYEEYEFTYNSWDTIGQEFRNIRDIEEEQATSEITILVIEKVKKGIFRTKNLEKARIEVIYDYKTGRWGGDDFFDDCDGYGHYVGDTFEVWFNIYQTDFDQDGIPYWTEVNVLNTDPQVDDSKLDPDQDGIPTSWEWRWNYNPFIWDDHVNLDSDIDGIENIEEYQMRKWFADPYTQDIYIEVDGMKKGGLFDKDHILYEESKQIIIERFCRHGINVYIDNGWPGGPSNGGGELLPYVEKKKSWDSGMVLQYYKHHFPDERKEIFRYIIICGNLGSGYCGNTVFNRFDTILMGSSTKAILKLWLAYTPRTKRTMLASLFLHELGHSLSIGPNTFEGCDNFSYGGKFIPTKERKRFLEQWGNYKSVMNYYYLFNKGIVDYSDGSHGYNDQNDWEKFYLPYFQIETNVVVDPFYYPITKEGINENVSIKLDGWEYSKELTQKYVETIPYWSNIDPLKYNWSVYVKTDKGDSLSDRNIRIYIRPQVPISVWSLFKEGYLDEEGNINLC